MSIRRVVCAAVAVLSTISGPALALAACGKNDAEYAQHLVDHANDWTSLEAAFHRYPECDDSALAEGYDDKIATMLVDRWNEVSDLNSLFMRNPMFETFVLKHVDSLMSPSQTKKIVAHASMECPAKLSDFCEKLKAQAQSQN